MLIGVILVDLVFDFTVPLAAALTYYKAVVPSPLLSVFIPVNMALFLVCFVARIKCTGSGWLSLALFAACAPYFELIVKPAELALIQIDTSDMSAQAAENFLNQLEHFSTIKLGHVILLPLIIVIMVLNPLPGLCTSVPVKED